MVNLLDGKLASSVLLSCERFRTTLALEFIRFLDALCVCVFSNLYCDHFSALSHAHFVTCVCFSYIEW